MLVTGVQAAGSKGVSAVQGTVVDTTRGPHSLDEEPGETKSTAGRRLKGDPQPVVFQRNGVDNRPIALRHEKAAARYRADGDPDHDEAA